MLGPVEIMDAMGRGDIVIDPFHEGQLGTNSYDGRIGPWYYPMSLTNHATILLGENHREMWGDLCHAGESSIPIPPHSVILAHTQEIVGGRNGYVATMKCRSGIARSSLSVARCAGVGDVGFINIWTMEIVNHCPYYVFIPVGMKVCQFVFEKVEGAREEEYSGSYQTPDWAPEYMLPALKKDIRQVRVFEDRVTTTGMYDA